MTWETMDLWCLSKVDYDFIDRKFVHHYAILLSKIITRDIGSSCTECLAVDNPLPHTCKKPSDMVRIYGGSLLKEAKFSEPYDTWHNFISDIFDQNIRQKALEKWLGEFRGLEFTVSAKRHEIADQMDKP